MGKFFFIISFLLIATVLSVSAAEENKGAEKITIKGGSFGDIDFPHQKHQNTLKDCNTCHNMFPKKNNVITEMKTAGTLKAKQVMDYCRDCHKTMKKEGQKTGPLGCKQCHN